MTSVLAQTAGDSSDPLLGLLQYGAIGIVLVALLLGWLWAKPAVQQLIRVKERAEQQRDELLKAYEDRVVPVLVEFTEAAQKLTPLLEEVIRRSERDGR